MISIYVHDDDKLSIVYRLMQSAMEGVAKNNLRLMCRVINGMADKNVSEASIFLKYAKILADLSEDEIIVLGMMAKHHSSRTEEEIHDRDEEIKEIFGDKIESINQP